MRTIRRTVYDRNVTVDCGASALRAAPAVLIASLFLAGAAAPSQADESIGGATTVVNLVTGDLASGTDVHVVQGDDVFADEGANRRR